MERGVKIISSGDRDLMTDSSESDTCDGTSGDDDPIDLEEIQGEPQGQEAAALRTTA